MARLEFAQRIDATPALVAAFFVPQRMPYWYGYEMKAEFEILGGASDFAAGQKVRITGRLGAREVTLTAVVTRYEFGRALEWQFQDQYGVKGKQSWEIAAQNESDDRAHARRVRNARTLRAHLSTRSSHATP